MSYDNLEKITSTVFRPCNTFALKHVVQLSKKNKEGRRQYFHREVTYNSNKYVDKKYLKSISIDFYSYLLLEEQGKDWTDRESIMLYNVNLPNFKNGLREVVSWFQKEEYDDLFYTEGGRLKFNPEFGNVKETIRLGETKSVMFRPTVIEDNFGTLYEGVEMYVNTNIAVGYITIDNLMAMYEIISTFNLYQSSLELINYVQRPDFDKFNYDMEDDALEQHVTRESNVTQVSKGNNTGELKSEMERKLGGFFNSI